MIGTGCRILLLHDNPKVACLLSPYVMKGRFEMMPRDREITGMPASP